jgi:hypothetical protein
MSEITFKILLNSKIEKISTTFWKEFRHIKETELIVFFNQLFHYLPFDKDFKDVYDSNFKKIKMDQVDALIYIQEFLMKKQNNQQITEIDLKRVEDSKIILGLYYSFFNIWNNLKNEEYCKGKTTKKIFDEYSETLARIEKAVLSEIELKLENEIKVRSGKDYSQFEFNISKSEYRNLVEFKLLEDKIYIYSI